MNEAEDRLAAELEAGRDDEDEWGDERVEMDVRPSRTQVVSFRMPLEELETVVAAATASGESLSEFIRTSIALRVAPQAPARPLAAIETGVARGAFNFLIARAPYAAGRNRGDDVEPIEVVAQRSPDS